MMIMMMMMMMFSKSSLLLRTESVSACHAQNMHQINNWVKNWSFPFLFCQRCHSDGLGYYFQSKRENSRA